MAHGPRTVLCRLGRGGHLWADEGGGQVRPGSGISILNLRDVVDSELNLASNCRQESHSEVTRPYTRGGNLTYAHNKDAGERKRRRKAKYSRNFRSFSLTPGPRAASTRTQPSASIGGVERGVRSRNERRLRGGPASQGQAEEQRIRPVGLDRRGRRFPSTTSAGNEARTHAARDGHSGDAIRPPGR